MTHAGATAMLNGSRHFGSPNILYGDGSVRADATKKIDPLAAGFNPPSAASDADYVGALAQTWPDWHETFGTYYHLIPVCKFPGAGL